MSNEHEIEIKCVFSLLDPTNSRELHVQQISNLVQNLEKLGSARQRSKTVEKVEEASLAKAKLKPARETDKRNSNFMISTQKPIQKGTVLKKTINDTNNENGDKVLKPQEIKQNQEEIGREAEILDKDKQEFALKMFPNKKKTMNYDEFADFYQDIFATNMINEDILLRCFSLFDQDKQGYLNAKAIKKVFEVFNEKVTDEDIENLLKFVGCSSERMTFQEFKEFFKKNI